MSTNNELKALHDQFLEMKPEGVDHDAGACPLCAMEATDSQNSTTPGGPMPESFTQEDVDAAVAAATADLTQRLEELGAQVQKTEVDKAVAAATAEYDAKVAELQAQLDAAQVECTAARNELAEANQFWADAIAAHQEAAAFAARRDERVAKAREAGVLPEDYLTANADRFAAMADDDFAARLDEWRLIASKVPEGATGSSQPPPTALVASAEGQGAPPESNLAVISELRARRIDPRALGGA